MQTETNGQEPTLQNLHELLLECKQSLQRIEERLETSTEACDRMVGHINFVENVWQLVRRPFLKACGWVNSSSYLPIANGPESSEMPMHSCARHR